MNTEISATNQQETLADIAQEIRVCTACPLHETRGRAVPGVGPDTARAMLVGEAPGSDEDDQGEPFVGQSGQELNKMLKNGNTPRETTFLTNVIKCRPPNNRDPNREEIAACRHFLERQIAALNPDLIVAVGSPALSHFDPKARITPSRGILRQIGGRFIYPILHPACGMRRRASMPVIADDIKRIPDLLRICATPLPDADRHPAKQTAGEQTEHQAEPTPTPLSPTLL